MASESESAPPKKEEPEQKDTGSEKKDLHAEAAKTDESKSDTTSDQPKEKPVEQNTKSAGEITSALQTPADQTKYGSGNAGTDKAKAPEKPGQGEKPKFFASPLARKIALERGVPLGQIKGTGPEGRIVKVRRFSERDMVADKSTGGR